MKDTTFKIINDGVEKEYNIIKIVPSSKMNKNYIIYSDDRDIYAARCEIKDNKIKLFQIEDDKEYDYLDEILNKDGDYNE